MDSQDRISRMSPKKNQQDRNIPVKFLRVTLWIILFPSILLAGMMIMAGLAFGGALFKLGTSIITILWLAICSLPFVTGYALKYTAKRPERLLWATIWVWSVVGAWVLLTVFSSGVLG